MRDLILTETLIKLLVVIAAAIAVYAWLWPLLVNTVATAVRFPR